MDITTRTKIDAIWQGMWDNGMADAKTNITQMTHSLKKKQMLMLSGSKLRIRHLKKVFISKMMRLPSLMKIYAGIISCITQLKKCIP